MRHLLKVSIVSVAVVALLALAIPATLNAQTAEPPPKMADGHPDLSGVWWTGGDVGGRGYNTSHGAAPGGRGAAPPPTFTGLYNQAAKDATKNLSYKAIPTDGRQHREDLPPSYRGDSVGHWEGDTFVVDTRNFTDDTWMSAEGRVSPHSDQMHIVERYHRVDKNTLEIDATITDPKMLTAPWTVPTQRLVLAPFDQLLPLLCSGVETAPLMDAADKLKKN